MSLSLSQRQEYASAHARALATLLARPSVKTQPQRIFRARLWLETIPGDSDYLVMTLVQSTTAQRLLVFVTRPFPQAIGAAAAKMELSGAYSVDEVVAFLTLDRVDPDEVEWRDETGTDIVTASDILGKFQG